MTAQQKRWLYPKSEVPPEVRLVWGLAAIAYWPMFILCAAIDGAHAEQGRHLPKPGALPLMETRDPD